MSKEKMYKKNKEKKVNCRAKIKKKERSDFMKQIKEEKGITLIALVVTIVVLLILAGISINAIIGDNGIVGKAKEAQNKMENAIESDKNAISSLSNWLDEALSGMENGETGGNEEENTTGENTTGGNTTGGNTTGGGGTSESQSPKVTIGGSEVTLTEQNVGQYLGKVVSNYKSGATGTTESITIGSTSYTVSTKYRLYYVDFDNKYGDGEGTIYLKADCTSNKYELRLDSTSADAENVKIKNLNPALYAEGVTSPATSNMKAVTWLTNTSNWAGLKDTSATISSKINYVVGSPSLEMMMDSYNTHYGLTGTTPDTSTLSAEANRVKLFYQYPYSGDTNNYGYGVGPSNDYDASNGYNTYTSKYTVKTDSAIDSMYYPGDDNCYWLASPSANNSGGLMYVRYYNGGYVDSNGYYMIYYSFCPVVSLQSDVQLELEQ